MPPPRDGGAYLFESGTQIPTVTIAGVDYDRIRMYCSLTP
jgi:hypothetical protein